MTFATQQPPRVGFTIIVSRPCAALRSNGGHGNHYAVNRARQDAKDEAYALTRYKNVKTNERGFIDYNLTTVPDGATVNIEYTELLGPRQHAMDDDNLIGAMKSYRDGIALALGINDKRMRVQPCGPCERGGGVSGVAVRVWIADMETQPQ